MIEWDEWDWIHKDELGILHKDIMIRGTKEIDGQLIQFHTPIFEHQKDNPQIFEDAKLLIARMIEKTIKGETT